MTPATTLLPAAGGQPGARLPLGARQRRLRGHVGRWLAVAALLHLAALALLVVAVPRPRQDGAVSPHNFEMVLGPSASMAEGPPAAVVTHTAFPAGARRSP